MRICLPQAGKNVCTTKLKIRMGGTIRWSERNGSQGCDMHKDLRKLIVVMVAVCAAAVAIYGTALQAQTTLITHVKIADGTGADPVMGAVRIKGNRIVAVGNLKATTDDTVIDGGGLVLAPGFIDTHSHHDGDVTGQGDPAALLTQGITTIILGQDGRSHTPLREFFGGLEENGTPVNVASYSGHGTYRRTVMGDDFRRKATLAEVEKMRGMLAADMAAGAIGLSTGLEYDPGIYSTTTEVLMLAREAAKAGGRYISHMRSEDRYFEDALEEILLIGKEAGLPVQISHTKLARKGLWGSAAKLIERLEQARADGIDITADIYPYTYWSSTMQVLIPDRDFTNRKNFEYALEQLAPPDGYYLVHYAPDPRLIDKSFSEIAKMRGTDPVTLYMDLVKESMAWREQHPDEGRAEGVIGTSMHEDDIATIMAWPHTNICSDGSSRGGHPRGWGAFPRMLGVYSRERGVLGLAQAINRMSLVAAQNMGIRDRGVIREGAFADLVLIDPQNVIDRARIGKRGIPSIGIEMVWVNGKLALDKGKVTDTSSGTVIRRGD